MLLAGLGLLVATACAPSRVSTPPPAAQARPPAPQETAPLGTITLPPLPPGAQPSAPSVAGAPPGIPGAPPPVPSGEVVVGIPLEPPTVTIRAGTHVAILLPLSGRDAAVGRALLDAAELAVFDFGDDHFVLDAYDTESKGAGAAAQQALTDGAQLILGPLFARSVGEVAGAARPRNVNVVSFSNDRTVAAPGVFVMGLPPSDAVARAVAYARSKGVMRFGALLPSDTLGNRIAGTLEAAAAKLDAEVVRVEYYDPGATDLSGPIKRVAEFERRRAAFVAQSPAAAQKRTGRGQTTGETGFEALVLGEGGQRLRTIAPLLPFYDIDPAQVHLIGTPAWEDQSLATEPALVGSWFAAPDPAGRAEFDRKYREAYGRSAPRIATLAYDATGLAAVLARHGGTPDFSATTLSSPSGFAGIDGIFRFAPDGVVERGLAVLQLDRRTIQVISPAPTTFEAAVQ
ncbi:MAG: penicillin-binding protein activator [Proteobacteria bacterium]|nr:penicillin-binding protein activator [Pseudomonadota bacterium]